MTALRPLSYDALMEPSAAMLHCRNVPAAKPSCRVSEAVELAAFPVSGETLPAEPKSRVTVWGVATPAAAAKATPRDAVVPPERAPAVSKVTAPLPPVSPVMFGSVVAAVHVHCPGVAA
jgi:hypothetical protein